MESFINDNLTEITAIINKISNLKKRDPDKTAKIIGSSRISGVEHLTKPLLLYIFNRLNESGEIHLEKNAETIFLENIKSKNIRTISGVTPVTIMTKPYPCPGKCIYCPNEKDMPKSYLAKEPGAQRALANNFNPYRQTFNRLKAYSINGHPTDKVEIIIIGGTWSFYKRSYQRWFIYEIFRALNNFNNSGNRKINNDEIEKIISFKDLEKIFKINETAKARCVGLSIETRPDFIDYHEAVNLRKLGVTKVQLGVQSLNEKVLKIVKRGHTVEDTKKAFKLLRSFGFKIQIHWMPNLPGSDPKHDLIDFNKLFTLKYYKPDEIKIYPCSLIGGTELEKLFNRRKWKPYSQRQLTQLLTKCLISTPRYCRVSRVIRDISSEDIISGNRKSNLRQDAEHNLKGQNIVEIRYREMKNSEVRRSELGLKITSYNTSTGKDIFLEIVDVYDRIAGFLRLSCPKIVKIDNGDRLFPIELMDSSLIREVHVYGVSVPIGTLKNDAFQHLGLGKFLIKISEELSLKQGFRKISVISAVGTKGYYKNLGFLDGGLYQFKKLA